MKSSRLFSIILGFATIGLSLPVHADEVTSNETIQTAIVTGNNNFVTQNSSTTIVNHGTKVSNNRGTSIRTRQIADVDGDNNTVNQAQNTRVENTRHRRYPRYHN